MHAKSFIEGAASNKSGVRKKTALAHGHPALLLLVERSFLKLHAPDLFNVVYFDAKEISSKRLCDEICHDTGKKVAIIRNAECLEDFRLIARYADKAGYLAKNVKTLFLAATLPELDDISRRTFIGLNDEEQKHKVPRECVGLEVDCERFGKKSFAEFVSNTVRVDTPMAEKIVKHFSGDIERTLNFIKIVRSSGITVSSDNLKYIADKFYGEDLAMNLLAYNKAEAISAAKSIPASEVLGCLDAVARRLEQLETLSEAEHSKLNTAWLIREGRLSQGMVQLLGGFVKEYPLDIIDRCFEVLGEAYEMHMKPDTQPLLWLTVKWPT